MSTQEKQKENLLVKLVKKSVGLPTSDCCGAPAPAESAQPLAAREESPDCECGQAETVCGCEQEEQMESKTA